MLKDVQKSPQGEGLDEVVGALRALRIEFHVGIPSQRSMKLAHLTTSRA